MKKIRKRRRKVQRLTGNQYKEIIEKTFIIPDYNSTDLVPFKINAVQKDILDGMDDRNIILKSRKHGVSTLVLAICIINCNEFSNHRAIFIANSQDNTNGIFKKAKDLLGRAKYTFDADTTKKDIKFGNGSSLVIATAGATAAFRGDDTHTVHLSENAFFEKPDVYAAALESGTDMLVFIESTANGRNHYYDLWTQSMSGKKAYKPFFLPWFKHPDNFKDLPKDFTLSQEEKNLKKKYDLDDQQVMWWRWKPTVMIDPDTFLQEHPSEPEDAFLSSGRPVFHQGMLARAKKNTSDYRVGSLELGKDYELHFFDSDKNRPEELIIFGFPEDGHQYIIGADVAKGKITGDNNVAFVLDANTKEQVAEFCSKCDPDLFATKLNDIGRFYNNALVACEANDAGHTVNSSLWNKYNYPRLYMRDIEKDNMSPEVTDDIGFRTNEATKNDLVVFAKRTVRIGAVKINSMDCIEELLAYEHTKTGKMSAPSGKNDDRVIAFMIANFVLERYPEYQSKYYPEKDDTSVYFDLIQKSRKSKTNGYRNCGY